jgi:hypothetical protein
MRRLTVIAVCCAATLAAPVARAGAASAAKALAELNAERAANGIPAGVSLMPRWSADCAAHDGYMSIHRALSSTEVVGSAGYSAGGAFAARSSALIHGSNWNHGNPYESAPIHLDQLLAPRLAQLGSADRAGYSCTTTFPGWTRADPAVPTTYSYPGDGGRIYANETAGERPFTPGELIGFPPRTLTGPYLVVLADAPGATPFNDSARLSDATLTGPSGAVAVRSADGATTVPDTSATLSAYTAPGGFIIPTTPLLPGATYRAHVLVTFAGVQSARDWSFVAQAVSPASSLLAVGQALSFRSRSPAPIRVSFSRSTGAAAPALTIAPGRSAHARLQPGTWQACAVQAAAQGFAGYERCLTIAVAGSAKLSLGRGAPNGRRLRFPLHFSSVLRGRTATLSVRMLLLSCVATKCRLKLGTTSIRKIVLGGPELGIGLPAIGEGVRVTFSTPAFQLGEIPFSAASAVRTFLRS